MSTPVQPRCHLHLPIIDSSGVVFPYASITLLEADGTPLTTNAYVQADGGNPVAFPLFTDPAIVDIWTDDPARVRIIAEVSANVRIVLDGIDIMPPAQNIVRAAQAFQILGADAIPGTAVLMASTPGHAQFRVTDPVETHEHEGDSAGSVSLTYEEPADFNPFQTWVGYHAGRDTAPSSTGSSAFGARSELDGASSTIMGFAGIVPHVATGVSGDMATVLSSEDGDASAGSTVAGPGNLTAQGRDMTVLGGLNGPPNPSAVPTGATVIGAGNVVGSAGAVKVGPNHPTSDAGPNHTTVGPGNTAQNNGLPWAGAQTPYALGGSSITLGGDPSDQASASDWFGGVGPLAMGTNATTFSPSIGLVQGNAVTQTALRAVGDVVVNGQRTWSDATTTLGFYGKTGTVRPDIPVDPSSVVNTVFNQTLSALASTGLVYTNSVPLVYEGAHRADGTPMEFAETGQALQWKLPPTSPDYRASNDFAIASSKVVLNAANSPFPTRGVPAIYSAGRANVIAQAQFTYNPTGTNLITNPGFETNTGGWGNWDSSTVTRDTTKAKYGSASGKISTSTGTAVFSRVQFGIAGIAPGTTLNFSCYVNPATLANRNVKISIEAADASWSYVGFVNGTEVPASNGWTRVSVSGTTPVGSANIFFVVGYHSANGSTPIPTSDFIWIDAAQVVTGAALPPYVADDGFHPDDHATGLMVRSLHEKSIVGGQTIATTKGYLVSRKNVYIVSGNTITGTAATHSTPVASGQMLQADCNGTSVIIRANGTQISAFTDSTWTTRVKFGYRLTPSTNVSDFLVLPFGF